MEKVKGLGSICKSEKSLKSGRGEEEEKKTPMEKYSFQKKVTKKWLVGWCRAFGKKRKRPRGENILFKKWKIRGWRAFGRLRKVELGEEVHLGGNCKCRRRAKFYSNMFIEDDRDNDDDGDDEVDDDYEVDEEGYKCLACFSSSVAIALKYIF